MFTIWFCPKLQDKHCKSTMTVTMTEKTRYYMPPPKVTKNGKQNTWLIKNYQIIALIDNLPNFLLQ